MAEKVTKEFVEDFGLAMAFWNVPFEEKEIEKQRCRDNLADAKRCYSSIAYEVRHLQTIRAEKKRLAKS